MRLINLYKSKNKAIIKSMSIFLLCLGLLSSCKTTKSGMSETVKPTYIKKEFTASSINLPYNILMPKKMKDKLPLVVFLHGAGERGNDNELQLVHGSKMFIDSFSKYPAIYLFPQCPKDDYWANVDIDRDAYPLKLKFPLDAAPTTALSAVLELIDYTLKKYDIDKSAIKILGLSMGGMGTFEILYRRPDLFDSAIAICGGGHPDFAKKYDSNLRLWIAHGENDNIVPPAESTYMNKAAEDNNIKVKYTTYPGVGHNSWDYVFEDPTYLSWLFGID